MFGRLAPKLRDNGWSAVIPLCRGEKRPAISGWEGYNIRAPGDLEIERWAQTHEQAGIGLAFGPDGVLGCDLDFLDAEKAADARRISGDTLGHTPMTRIGRFPKVLAFYRAAPGLHVPGKNFGGFEIFSKSGQTVLYGIHPDTKRPYCWPDESPETISPGDLPTVTQDMLDTFVAQMEPLREDRVIHKGAAIANTGAASSWLKRFCAMATADEMIDAACAGIRGVGVGARHSTMQAATMALVMRGITPDEFLARIEEAYSGALTAGEARARRNTVKDAARWANSKAWCGAVNIQPVRLRVDW